MREFRLPDLGEGLQEAEILQWLVAEGDPVRLDQPLLTVETAKAAVEVPSPVAGVLLRQHFQAGDIVSVGAILASFDPAATPAAPAAPPAEAPIPATLPPAARDHGTVAGSLEESDEIVQEAEQNIGAAGGIKCTPAVRALARKLGVDLKVVTPSGPNESITRSDIERVHKILQEVEPMEELRGPRRAMATTLASANAEVVSVTVLEDADITAWLPGADMTCRLIRSIAAASRAEPALNGWFFPKELGRRLLHKLHIGIAMDTPDGLFVPVIFDAETKTGPAIRAELEAIKQEVRNRTIPKDKLRGHTFTLSNFGMFAGRYASPVIVPPTMGILAAGRLREEIRPWQGAPAIRKILPLSLSFDHRAITGGEATRWLKHLLADLELPA